MFFYFHPENWGDFDYIFQMDWNQQLVINVHIFCLQLSLPGNGLKIGRRQQACTTLPPIIMEVVSTSPFGDFFHTFSRTPFSTSMIYGRKKKNIYIYKTFLGGGFKHFLCSSLLGEDSHFDWYFSDGLKPPTSFGFTSNDLFVWWFQPAVSPCEPKRIDQTLRSTDNFVGLEKSTAKISFQVVWNIGNKGAWK